MGQRSTVTWLQGCYWIGLKVIEPEAGVASGPLITKHSTLEERSVANPAGYAETSQILARELRLALCYADRMAKWIDEIEMEHCGDGVRDITVNRAADARRVYRVSRGHPATE